MYIFPTSLGLHTILVPRSGILSITLQTSYKSGTLSMTIYNIHFKERAYVSSSQIVFNRWGRALKWEVLECSRSTGLWLNSIVRLGCYQSGMTDRSRKYYFVYAASWRIIKTWLQNYDIESHRGSVYIVINHIYWSIASFVIYVLMYFMNHAVLFVMQEMYIMPHFMLYFVLNIWRNRGLHHRSYNILHTSWWIYEK